MAKKESTFGGMLLTLILITFISSASLGLVFELTKRPIAAAKAAKKSMAMKKVLPEYDNDLMRSVRKIPVDGDTMYIYTAKKGNDTVGYAVETFSNKGFGGKIRLLAGFLPNGTINNIAVLDMKETPGLGDKAQKTDWAKQFNGKNPATFKLSVKKDGGDVDAITASTITSRAYCDAVQRAYNTYKKEGGKK